MRSGSETQTGHGESGERPSEGRPEIMGILRVACHRVMVVCCIVRSYWSSELRSTASPTVSSASRRTSSSASSSQPVPA